MNFKDYLTPDERLGCWQAGFMRKLASVGKRPSDVGLTKEAFGIGAVSDFVKSVGSAAKDVGEAVGDVSIGTLGVGLAAGLPLGVLLHLADKSLRSSSKKTRELKAQRDAAEKERAEREAERAAREQERAARANDQQQVDGNAED